MEALSPRSANIPSKPRVQKQIEKTDEEVRKDAEAAKKAQKEKDYAPPPPEWVLQPPVIKGGLAEKYKTGRCLGKGGFAICYEGELRNKKSGSEKKIYALKVVKAKMNQRKMEEKFRTELQIHAKMQHPNIVEFHRAFTYKESTFVVLELCSNGSVMDMVKKRRCLSLPEVRRYIVQLCGAIKYMHARNVIHRDLKMGNLFLDHNMNLKIGDFGLAAVLVSPEEYQKGIYEHAKSRRTTLCGTPNYIAPEILEKGRGGHDYKVDIWAIGVIVFAMLVGQPPFQSGSQNEIYRKARNVDYDWPKTGKHHNDIPDEAKDLVRQLLKVEAEERPDPDQVVGHPFFAMHGGNAIPMIMEEKFRRETPSFLDPKQLPRGDVMLKDTQRLDLRTLARQCGVGHLAGDVLPQPAVGEDIDISLYGQCQEEEDSGRAPVVPLPMDMVYTSKFENEGPKAYDDSCARSVTGSRVPRGNVASLKRSERIDDFQMPDGQRQPPMLSHAATLRAAHANPKSASVSARSVAAQADNGYLNTKVPVTSNTRGKRGLLNELPVRPAQKMTDAGTEAKSTAQKPRTSRIKKVHVLDDDIATIPSEAQPTAKPISKDQYIDEAYSDPDAKRRAMSSRTRARIASNVQKELADTGSNDPKTSVEMIGVKAKSDTRAPKPLNALIGPDEVLECMPDSRPYDILRQLKALYLELSASLANISYGNARSRAHENTFRNRDIKHRPVVVKWVDYTNKFGIGYILQNGTVGCVFKGDESSFPTCVVVADAESHMKRRNNPDYSEKHQLVPKKGAPVEFIENCYDDGLKRVLVPPSRYQINVSSTGIADRLGPGLDIHDFEKRKKLSLWDKFGKYMTQTLGKSDGDSSSVGDSNTSRSRRNTVAGPFVKFYQRLGNVGIWGFADGSFQYNFPDHTKLVVAADGTWLDFYHLPLHTAQTVKDGGMADAVALADRGVLCYPTNVMLGGEYRGHMFADVIKANELQDKLAFVKDVVGLWVQEGGLGCVGTLKGLKWEGMKENGGKLVWVTVGAKGGDNRYEMPAKKVNAGS